MSPTEVYAVQAEMMALISGLWELWLGGTFAVIVAFHAGRDSLNLLVLVVGCLIYVTACTSIAMRYVSYAVVIGQLNGQLQESGFSPFPFPDWFVTYNGRATTITFFLGTVATLVFAIIQYSRRRRDA